MAKNQQTHNQMDWLDAEETLTPDQWLAIHLVFLNLLETVVDNRIQDLRRPDLLDYMDKAKDLFRSSMDIRSSMKITQVSQRPAKLEAANKSLRTLYGNVSHSDSESSSIIKERFFRFLDMVAKEAIKRIKGSTTFKKFFDDIHIDADGNVRSLKAKDMVSEYMGKIKDVNGKEFKDVALSKRASSKSGKSKGLLEQKEEVDPYDEDDEDPGNLEDWEKFIDSDDESWADDDHWEEEFWGDDDDDDIDPSEKLLARYEDMISEDKDVLAKLSLKKALAFHAVNLRLCSMCFEQKRYTKYQRSVIKAVSSYRDGQNPKQQEFYLRSANEAYIKLVENDVEWIKEEYEDDSEESLKKDVFLLGSNFGLKHISKNRNEEDATKLLDTLSLNSDKEYVSDAVNSAADGFYISGDDLYQSLIDSLTPVKDVEEVWNDEEQEDEEQEGNGQNGKTPLYKTIIPGILQHMDLKTSVATHVVIPDIVLMHLPKKCSIKYRKASKAFVSAYMDGENKEVIEQKRHKADEALLSLRGSFEEVIQNGNDEDSIDRLFEYLLTHMAIDECLMGMRDAKTKAINKFLKDLVFHEDDKKYSSIVTLQLATHFLDVAFKTYQLLYKKTQR